MTGHSPCKALGIRAFTSRVVRQGWRRWYLELSPGPLWTPSPLRIQVGPFRRRFWAWRAQTALEYLNLEILGLHDRQAKTSFLSDVKAREAERLRIAQQVTQELIKLAKVERPVTCDCCGNILSFEPIPKEESDEHRNPEDDPGHRRPGSPVQGSAS